MSRIDWVPCESYGAPVALPDSSGVTPTDIILATPVQISEAPQVTAPDEADDITVLRTIGQFEINIFNVSGDLVDAAQAQLSMRLRTAVQDSLGSPLTYTDDLRLDTDANEPFLWQRYINGWPAAISGGNQFVGFNLMTANRHPFWTSIDCRVKRRLSLQESTVLSVALFWANVPGGFSAQIVPFIRTLVKVRR